MSGSLSGVSHTTDELQGRRVPSQIAKHLAYGEAALMLIECLMLSLVEQRVLTTQELVEAVENAIATKHQMVADREHPEIASVAAGILSTLANSLAAGKVTPPARPTCATSPRARVTSAVSSLDDIFRGASISKRALPITFSLRKML